MPRFWLTDVSLRAHKSASRVRLLSAALDEAGAMSFEITAVEVPDAAGAPEAEETQAPAAPEKPPAEETRH